jgi:hypothetical protein
MSRAHLKLKATGDYTTARARVVRLQQQRSRQRQLVGLSELGADPRRLLFVRWSQIGTFRKQLAKRAVQDARAAGKDDEEAAITVHSAHIMERGLGKHEGAK